MSQAPFEGLQSAEPKPDIRRFLIGAAEALGSLAVVRASKDAVEANDLIAGIPGYFIAIGLAIDGMRRVLIPFPHSSEVDSKTRTEVS